MTLTKALLWLLLVVAVLAGMGVAVLQQKRRKKRAVTKMPGPEDDETVYSGLGEDQDGIGFDMDPLSEAEVYLAYGNKEAALRVLDQAASAEPERTDVLAKIEEIKTGDGRI
jgi:pilus assembly protein FimV